VLSGYPSTVATDTVVTDTAARGLKSTAAVLTLSYCVESCAASSCTLLYCTVLLLRCVMCAVRNASKPVPRQVTADGVLFGRRVKDLSELVNDDQLAAEEAAAQGGIPGEHCLTLSF
jgi:hypothetical protein